MDKVFEIIGNFANVIGIVSAIVAVIAWLRTRKHAKNVNSTLEIIQNYRKVEIYTEVSKKIELIRTEIRAVLVTGKNITKKYQEMEKIVREVIQALPTRNNEMIEKMKEVEKELREHGDNNKKIIDEKQTKVLADLDFVTIQLKVIMEELRQEV